MADSSDIVQRITQNIQVFQRSKVQLGEPLDVVMPAARVGDLIKHKSFWGVLAGAVAGAMINSAPYLLCGLLGLFGAAARIALTIGSLTNNDPTPSWADKAAQATEEFINEIFDSPDGKITLGMPSVLVNNQPIATTLIPNSIACNNHALQMIAEGSETVFVADKNVARKGDKTTCGAIIQSGSPNVFIGSGKAQVANIADEFSFVEKAVLVAVDMGFPPSRKGLKNGLGKIRLGIGNLDKTIKEVIPKDKKFIGSLKGNKYELKNVFIKRIDYIKRKQTEAEKLRNKFNSTEKPKFLKELGKQQELLEKQGFSRVDIEKIQNGQCPSGWQVHHKLPLDDGGTNNFENLALTKNAPYHKVITNYQRSVTAGMKVGEIRSIEWPIMNRMIYPMK